MKSVLLILMLLFSVAIHGQEYKRGLIWYLGFPGVFFDFNLNPVNFYQYPNLGAVDVSSCVSNTNGQFQFTCGGFMLGDKILNLMDNGDSINCPQGYKLYHHTNGSGLLEQMTLILPKKGNQYYVFCVGMSDSAATNYINHTYTEFDVLSYSVVDMDSNNGKGKVIEKNTILAENQHYINCEMQAVRHGNGKDWWLCKADCEEHRFQLYLVKEDTIEGPFYQYVPTSDTVDYCVFFSTLMFSEDGTKMLSGMYGNRENGVYISPNRVDVFDFDRCTGTLTYRNHYEVPFDTTTYLNPDYKEGLCFSPDGKLVYMSTIYSIYQIDVEDTNRYNAMYITGPDTFFNNFPWYNEMKIAPDGRIYIGTVGVSRPYMSYIAQPNVRGLGCQFTPNGIWQPYANLSNPPNMPNYALGEDSLHCWPVSTSNLSAPQGELLVYPNPTSDEVHIESLWFQEQETQLELLDMLGHCVLKRSIPQGVSNYIINTRNLQAGVYMYKLQTTQGVLSGKLIKAN
ncbi:MAG: T9SS type A sorting domain-containing protein [Chitinophagaceae bacterium]